MQIGSDPHRHFVDLAQPFYEPAAPPATTATRTRTRSTARRGRPAQQDAEPQPLAHGYDGDPGAAAALTPVLPKLDSESHIHPDLRSLPIQAPTANMMQATMPQSPDVGLPVAGPSGQAMVPMAVPVGGGAPIMGDLQPDGRKAKRELSQSKRAAQNRAAQRAFRQRKEGYIKKLEQQVKDFTEMENTYKAAHAENYHLREYVIDLQARLIGAKIDPPPPPAGINLHLPGPGALQSNAAQHNSAMLAPGGDLVEVAQAVTQLGNEGQYTAKGFKPEGSDDVRVLDDARRELAPRM